MKIYVASSWRNAIQPTVVAALRMLGHEVYDFRNPPERTGFSWQQTGGSGGPCTADEYRKLVDHPIAIAGYESDRNALQWCDACVFVYPCGRSASWELGYAHGLGKRTYILQLDQQEPELMFRESIVLGSWADFVHTLAFAGVP